jgi:hypothetical protein
MLNKLFNTLRDNFTSTSFEISDDMLVIELKRAFRKTFGLSLRVYKGRHLAEDGAPLNSFQKGTTAGGKLSLKATMRVDEAEKAFLDRFGLTVQVADAEDKKLSPNDRTLGEVALGEHK